MDPSLLSGQQHALMQLLHKNLHLFSIRPTDLGCTLLVSHDIVTKVGPVRQVAYRESNKERGIIMTKVEKLLDADVASPSLSPSALPVVFMEKKDGSTWFCKDY